jgi:hypothetical protein
LLREPFQDLISGGFRAALVTSRNPAPMRYESRESTLNLGIVDPLLSDFWGSSMGTQVQIGSGVWVLGSLRAKLSTKLSNHLESFARSWAGGSRRSGWGDVVHRHDFEHDRSHLDVRFGDHLCSSDPARTACGHHHRPGRKHLVHGIRDGWNRENRDLLGEVAVGGTQL